MNGASEQRQLGPVEVDGDLPRPDDTRATGGRSATYPPAPYPMSRAALTQPVPTYTAEIGMQAHIHILASYRYGAGLTEQRPHYDAHQPWNAQREIPSWIPMGSSGGIVPRAIPGGSQILSV